MPEKSSKRSPELKLFSILESLPCINAKVNNFIQDYKRMKHSSLFLRMSFWILEIVLKTWWNLGMLLLFCVPSNILKSQPVLLLDDLICHQLEFIEQKLSKKTGTEFRPQNSPVQRCLKVLSLASRLLFLWPRTVISLVVSSWKMICNEIFDDMKLASEIFSGNVGHSRRTTTRVPKKRLASSASKRKRKQEEEIEGEVEHYLFINESYQSENDPDYEIGETTFDSEVSCSESGSDAESVDTKGFLCEECREECECGDIFSETREKNCNEIEKDSEEECDIGLTFDTKEESGGDDTAVNFGANIDAVEDIASPTTPPVDIKGLTIVGNQIMEPESPMCKKG